MLYAARFSVQVPSGDVLVCVDPAVAEEGPMGAARAHLREIAGGDEHFFSGPAFDQETSARIRDEAAAPELDAALGVALVAYPVHRAHVDAVGDGVASLDRLPGRLLLRPVLVLLRREPPDGCGIE